MAKNWPKLSEIIGERTPRVCQACGDECIHFKRQPSLFSLVPLPERKRKRNGELVPLKPEEYLRRAQLDMLQAPSCYCDRSVPMAFQLPVAGCGYDDWGYRPWRTCQHFEAAPKHVTTYQEAVSV